MGFVDPIDAGAQLLPRALGAITSLFGLAPNRVSNFLDSEAARVDNIVRDRNSAYESERAAEALPSTEKPGFDLARLAGNVANPATWLGGAPTFGVASSRNNYLYSITKTGAATFIVDASLGVYS